MYVRVLLILIVNACMAQPELFAADTLQVPVQRQYFHDKIKQEQDQCDRADGKKDQMLRISQQEEINLQATDALYRKVNVLRNLIEENPAWPQNNDKIRYLTQLENLLKEFRLAWKKKQFNPLRFPELVQRMEKGLQLQSEQKSLLALVDEAPYEEARVLANVWQALPEGNQLDNLAYLKFTALYPDKILPSIRPYVQQPFADSLLRVACLHDPVQVYTYAQAGGSPESRLIAKSRYPEVQALAQLSKTPNALLYFPFLDDLLSGKQSIEKIKPVVGDGDKKYDSVGYYRLLVQTEIEYARRLLSTPPDTPLAMFGANGLREMLRKKALEHFINPINNLHEVNNLQVRMKAIEPLSPQELYYMLVTGENDLYTSSYKHSYNRLMQVMQKPLRGDELLQSVHYDYFKKFIKMAANYNRLDSFLKTMPAASSEKLMFDFVANLDKTSNLEDATDVADSYSSITDRTLLNRIDGYVADFERKSIDENNQRGELIYGLLKQIFQSGHPDNPTDLTQTLGIPSIYEIKPEALRDPQGRIVQQVFFYGDEDGKMYFPAFLNSFSGKDWKMIPGKEWVSFKSLKGNVWVYANKPLDNDANLDDSAQIHLNQYLEREGVQPSIVVHRGHSYWLPRTISRMPGDAKIVLLGSCGGYKNLSQILDISPDAHIISTKEIGAGEINRPIINYLNQSVLSNQDIRWKEMWQTLSTQFTRDPNPQIRESWESYIPPYRNLGAIFIKAYHKKTESL